MMDVRLRSGLVELSRLMIGERERWWIIGSTALVLAGVEGVEPDDIDVVASGDCLRRLLIRAGIAQTESKRHTRFRSDPYQRIAFSGATPIELMGDLEVDTGDGFHPIQIAGREMVTIGTNTVFIPPVSEQIAIFRLFSRNKDLAKAQLLEFHQRP